VADFYNHRVQKLSPSGEFVAFIGKSGRVGSGKLHYPTDVTLSPDGSIYVADAYNFRVQQFSSAGKFLRKWGGPLGLGIPGKLKGWFKVATGTAVDGKGNLYVADFDNHRIQKFSHDGGYITAFGQAGGGEGQFDRPTDIAVDSEGLVYVADFGNNRIQVFR
jgi:DNA-binding beta-propeller fold protein YncE